MNENELQIQYDGKPNIELLIIAANNDGSYTKEAVDAATSILHVRYGRDARLEQVWKKEMSQLAKLAEKCSVCQNPEVAYTSNFFLCTSPFFDGGKWLTEGPGGSGEKYYYVDIEFRLCPTCLAQRTHKGLFRKERVRIDWQDYIAHPLGALFKPLGYIEPKTGVSREHSKESIILGCRITGITTEKLGFGQVESC